MCIRDRRGGVQEVFRKPGGDRGGAAAIVFGAASCADEGAAGHGRRGFEAAAAEFGSCLLYTSTQTGLRGDGAGCSQNAPGVDVRSAQAGTGDAVSLPRLNSPATRGSEDERSKAAERIEARSAQRAARLRPQPRSEYEVLVEEVTGRRLPIYGQSLFVEPPSTFAPLEQSPVPLSLIHI